jgi:glutaredoxin
MNFTAPTRTGFTIYTKNACSYCDKVKNVLDRQDLDYTVVNCTEYLTDARTKEDFLAFIAGFAKEEYRTFPMVFYDGKFIGGFTETKAFCDPKGA